jgi:hypothetical protein
MIFALFRPIFVAVLAVALLSGCAGGTPLRPFYRKFSLLPPMPWQAPQTAKPGTWWEGDGAKGAPSIVVRLGEQRAYFYRDQKIVGATHISTGKKGYTTPTGSYAVIERDEHHSSSLYGDYVDAEGSVVQTNVDTRKHSAPAGAKYRGAKMPYFLRFSGGHGLHSGLVPNHPASHGCVRLPMAMAKHFFDNAPLGTPIRVEN